MNMHICTCSCVRNSLAYFLACLLVTQFFLAGDFLVRLGNPAFGLRRVNAQKTRPEIFFVAAVSPPTHIVGTN